MPPRAAVIAALLVAAPLVVGASGCGSGGATAADGGRIAVVAAEDTWGSIAAQLGGDRVSVTSIVTNPAADPHDYEPSAEDAREMATAQLAIVNGIGYDEWASNLLDASPGSGRAVIDVGDLVGLEAGDNPHQWYSPAVVQKAIAAIAAAYERADPGASAYFERRRRAFESRGLAAYHRLIARIRARYPGARVGASESIFEPLAAALGLDLVTPRGFMDAVSEGTEPSPSDKATADRQIADREIDLWVYNSQNATPDVQRLNDAARAAGIPVATVTETPTPEGASFQAWMVRELREIEAALGRGRG
jgi:zinc/manganese transport system substrate-binding protein